MEVKEKSNLEIVKICELLEDGESIESGFDIDNIFLKGFVKCYMLLIEGKI